MSQGVPEASNLDDIGEHASELTRTLSTAQRGKGKMKKLRRFAHLLAPIAMLGAIAIGVTQPARASSPVARASAATQSTGTVQPRISSAGCKVLEVRLNGTDAPTSRCVVTIAASRSMSPDSLGQNCTLSSLHLYSDSGYGGDVLCLTGYGSINLETIDRSFPYTWNDCVSSFQSFSSNGTLWQFNDELGLGYQFGGGNNTSASWANGDAWNDRASSVTLR